MIRFLGLGLVTALVGATAAFAQAEGSQTRGVVVPGPPVANGQGLHGTLDEQQKGLSPDRPVTMSIFAWTPAYRVSVMRRAPNAPSNAGSELHEDKTQIYFVLSGAATQILGGQPKTQRRVGNGNRASEESPVGAKSYHIKAGDVVVIPPMTWHQTVPDPGEPITFRMIDIMTPTRMP